MPLTSLSSISSHSRTKGTAWWNQTVSAHCCGVGTHSQHWVQLPALQCGDTPRNPNALKYSHLDRHNLFLIHQSRCLSIQMLHTDIFWWHWNTFRVQCNISSLSWITASSKIHSIQTSVQKKRTRALKQASYCNSPGYLAFHKKYLIKTSITAAAFLYKCMCS